MREQANIASLLVVILGLALTLFPYSAPRAQGSDERYALLLDASKSMTGFYNLPKSPWRSVLRALDQGASQHWRFGDDVEYVNGPIADRMPNYENTALNLALQAWLDKPDTPDVAIMVTDNVADTSDNDGPGAAQASFYKLLQQGQDEGKSCPSTVPGSRLIDGITLIPVVFPFKGMVTGPKNRPQAAYAGDRALAIYVFYRHSSVPVKGSGGETSIDKGIENRISKILADAGLEHDTIPILPFGADWAKAKPQLDLTIRSAKGADAKLTPDGTLTIANLPMEQGLSLGFGAGITPGANFKLKDAVISAAINLPNDSEITSRQLVNATVTPAKADFEPFSRRDFNVVFDVRPIGFFSGVSLMRQVELAFSTSTVIKGEITVSYRVASQGILFVGDAAKRWSYDGGEDGLGTNNSEIQRRLFHVQELIQGMSPACGSTKEIVRRPVVIELRYSTGVVVLLVGAVFLIGGPAVWALLRFAKPQSFDVTTGMSRPQPMTLSLFSTVPVASEDGRCAVTLTWLGFFIYVAARGGRLTGSRLLSSGGGPVRVTWNDGESRDVYNFQIKRRENAYGGGSRKRSLDDW